MCSRCPNLNANKSLTLILVVNYESYTPIMILSISKDELLTQKLTLNLETNIG